MIEDIKEIISQGLDCLGEIEYKEAEVNIDKILTILDQVYIPVLWPESQYLMEQEWFDECILDVDYKVSENSSSTYLVPINRYLEIK